MCKSFYAWLKVGSREALAVNLFAGVVMLTIVLSFITAIFWLSGADLLQRGPALALYAAVCLYATYIVVSIGYEKYRLAVIFKNFRQD